MPNKGHRRKKTRTHVDTEEQQAKTKIPKSFVIKRGSVGMHVNELVQNVRKVMYPYCAMNLKERKNNAVKDFVLAGQQMGVSHMVMFNKNDRGPTMRIARLPKGPTLSFKVHEYTLMKHIQKMSKTNVDLKSILANASLVVRSNFNNEVKWQAITSAMFQGMFPSINLETVKLSECRRVVLFDLDPETNHISFRHYAITAKPVGMNRNVSRVLKGNNLGKLADFDDVSDFILEGDGGMSFSETEDDANQVKLAGNFVGVGNSRTAQSAIRLKEIGPRMTLELIKIEDGICTGEVLYHSYIQKTDAEIKAKKAELKQKSDLKAKRKAQQEANVLRKKQEQEDKLAARKAKKEAKAKTKEDEAMKRLGMVEDQRKQLLAQYTGQAMSEDEEEEEENMVEEEEQKEEASSEIVEEQEQEHEIEEEKQEEEEKEETESKKRTPEVDELEEAPKKKKKKSKKSKKSNK